MKILFLGLMFCEESLNEAYGNSKCGVQMAPHLFQKRLLTGLDACCDDVTVFHIPPIGSFPFHYKKLFSKEYRQGNYLQIGYLNLPILKKFLQRRKMKKAILRYLSELSPEEPCNIVVYSLFEPFMDILENIKKRYSFVHITLIQTDAVPGRNGMNLSRKMVSLGNKLVREAKQVDDFVLLSRYLTEPLEVGDRNFVITECICDETQRASQIKKKSDKILLYSGTTEQIYGICDIVDAVKNIPEVTLWICGAGDSDEYIINATKEFANIVHFGYVSQERLSELRDKCDFLINPRRPTGTYTRYSFPSKTAEYLLSYKPVLMYKLEGIPDEYDPYINYLTGQTAKEIEEELRVWISADYGELSKKAMQARVFMLENKSPLRQAEKIVNMLNH